VRAPTVLTRIENALIVAAFSPLDFTRLPPSHRFFIANDQEIVSALHEGRPVFNADDRIKQIIDTMKT
jgi:hypothetical protein